MKTYLYFLLCGCLLLACGSGKQPQTPSQKYDITAPDLTKVAVVVASSHQPSLQRCHYGDSLTIELNITKIHEDTLKVRIYSIKNGNKKPINVQRISQGVFSFPKPPRIELSCRYSGFSLTYAQHMASTYQFFSHVFELRNNNPPLLKKIISGYSTRQQVHYYAGFFPKGIPINKYSVNNLRNLKSHNYWSKKIFYVNGFQTGDYTYRVFGSKSAQPVFLNDYVAGIRTNTINATLAGDPLVLKGILNIKNIDTQTVVAFNNLAYYLQQSGAFEGAIFLLEKIVKRFPDRMVAYINLGDAYWGLGKKAVAKEAYRSYVQKMKAAGKKEKIPKRVLERIK